MSEQPPPTAPPRPSASPAPPEERPAPPLAFPPGLQRLEPRARVLFYLQAFSRLVLVQWPMSAALGLGVGASFSSLSGFAASSAAALFFLLLALWMPWLSFERWGFELKEEELIIQRGVLFRSKTAIPTARVQHVDTRQGPLEQWFGLARVQIYTAAGMGADGVIPGLDLQTAEALRDELVRRHGDDGV